MSKLETGVLNITVEVEGRRLSFSIEEARTLKKILNDMFGESPAREYVPVYQSWPSCPKQPHSWEYQCDIGNVTFSVGNEGENITTY